MSTIGRPAARARAIDAARRFGVRSDGTRLDRTMSWNDLDRLDHVALLDLVEEIDAVQHLPEDGVLMIEPRLIDHIEEEIEPIVGHAQSAADVWPQTDLRTGERRALGPLRVAALHVRRTF